ncbi:DUF4355 domain-containing protein [Bacillus toyonensis]|uniref:DUF4355 domain-containing protein n=1 Tax=Bacillus toyonensis TaxID=155322 RepID=UPI000BF0E77C|nr:DUF4355 domain-containing protein [Bacillus toyonensis]PEK78333.1 hypothetical protein CN594_26475 [Bacillus toyonensis]PEO51234.1 hypothetical protein CN579_28460 [Bacillus toyonensis]PGD22110.1 hypothetical protein COM37_11175 [Bacillus toyonensis]PHD42662.1 hypothetical protein COF75_22685 [Bacillus toyonensis]
MEYKVENKSPFYRTLEQQKYPLKLNLQFFAEGEGEPNNPEDEEDDPEETVTLTQKELEERMQQEADKRVTAALKKREEKLRKEMEEKIKQERKEAEELAKLSAEERARVEAERREADLKKKEEALLEKERQFIRKQLEMDTVDVLRERKLPTTFSSFVLGEDAEGTLENIVKFQEEWQQAIEVEVNKRLASDVPRVGNKQTGTYNPWKKETFNLTEQARILKENPDLARKLQSQK